MEELSSEMKRNIEYVVGLVSEHPKEFDLFELTKETRLEHQRRTGEEPVGLKDARDAIQIAQERGLISTIPYNPSRYHDSKEKYIPTNTSR